MAHCIKLVDKVLINIIIQNIKLVRTLLTHVMIIIVLSSITLKSVHLIIMRSLFCFNLLYIIKLEMYVKMNFIVIHP